MSDNLLVRVPRKEVGGAGDPRLQEPLGRQAGDVAKGTVLGGGRGVCPCRRRQACPRILERLGATAAQEGQVTRRQLPCAAQLLEPLWTKPAPGWRTPPPGGAGGTEQGHWLLGGNELEDREDRE